MEWPTAPARSRGLQPPAFSVVVYRLKHGRSLSTSEVFAMKLVRSFPRRMYARCGGHGRRTFSLAASCERSSRSRSRTGRWQAPSFNTASPGVEAAGLKTTRPSLSTQERGHRGAGIFAEDRLAPP